MPLPSSTLLNVADVFVLDPFSNAFFGMIHVFLLHFDMSMSSMSKHWGLSVVGTGGDFLGAGCGWYRIEGIAGFDHYLFVTMQHLKSSNDWKLHLPHSDFSHEISMTIVKVLQKIVGVSFVESDFHCCLIFLLNCLAFCSDLDNRIVDLLCSTNLMQLVHRVKTFRDL